MEIINVRLTHKKADVSTLDSAFIRDIPKALKDIKKLDFPECCILQTCNVIGLSSTVLAKQARKARSFNISYQTYLKNLNWENVWSEKALRIY